MLSWMTTPTGAIFVGFLGIISHRFYFIKGEHHMNAHLYIIVWSLATLLVFSTIRFWNINSEYHGFDETRVSAIRSTTLINCAFFIPFFISVTSYRLSEHALRDFPGPLLAATSKLWHVYHMLRTKNHILLGDLQTRYGDFVRTGPQELTIIHPDVLGVIGGHGSPCIKAPVYDIQRPLVSLNTIRTKEGYAPRRRRWDDALGLSSSYIPDKEARTRHFASLLVKQIQASSTRPINVTTWFSHFAFDVMTDLAFGRSFDLIQNLEPASKLHHAPALLSRGIGLLRFFMPAPWIGVLCVKAAPYIPIISREWNNAQKWAADMCDVRLEQGDAKHRQDAFSRFTISARRDKDEESLDRLALYGDTFTFAVAGSHTTAAVLTMLFYELARRPELQERVREEATEAGVTETADNMAIAWDKLPLLDGCINEALRLYPALPTAGLRQTVDKPVKVGDTWIPPQTVVVAPRWLIGRLESAFEQAQDFVPERWTTKPYMVKNPLAFSPFANGRHTCPGKQLGLLEVRMAAAMILANFEFSLDPRPENQTRVVDDLQDAFTANPGKLEMIFKPLN
ncbi:cytochrome P450 [Hypoxylon sp. FL1150]|nr:cytochrome P450 [Hypoxylon sp. FL1150]